MHPPKLTRDSYPQKVYNILRFLKSAKLEAYAQIGLGIWDTVGVGLIDRGGVHLLIEGLVSITLIIVGDIAGYECPWVQLLYNTELISYIRNSTAQSSAL